MVRVWSIVVVAIAACQPPPQQYSYQGAGGGEERALPAVQARVVSTGEGERSHLPARSLSMPFSGARDGTELVAEYFQRADAAGAQLISDLAVYIRTEKDGQPAECRTEIVPETLTDTQFHAATSRPVYKSVPVTRQVTEHEYRCKPVSKYESRSVTEYQQRCRTERHPVQRSRTVYSSQYDYSSKSTRSVPRTEYYTDYESRYECHSEPVTRMKSEYVTKTECGSELVTKTVTRYEHQFENEYVPAHYEYITRQRLRELEPECYTLDEAADDPVSAPGAQGNRVEGTLYIKAS